MPSYRHALPQLADRLFLTDGGIETSLIFHEGLELPYFAAFTLLDDDAGRAAIARYYVPYIETARDAGLGFVLESPTWRASADWGDRLGYSPDALADVNRRAIALLTDLRERYEAPGFPLVISGNIGPRGDGYDAGAIMTPAEAEAYHAAQVRVFAAGEADLVTAATMTNSGEATGVVRAARGAGIPVAIAFTLETDGRLPTGQPLGEAIAEVDSQTGGAAAYFMINCAHPTHFDATLDGDEPWIGRLRGLRANASRRSHAELDCAPDLDDGDPEEFGREYAQLRARIPSLNVLGGCCGTDHRHVAQVAGRCVAAAGAA